MLPESIHVHSSSFLTLMRFTLEENTHTRKRKLKRYSQHLWHNWWIVHHVHPFSLKAGQDRRGLWLPYSRHNQLLSLLFHQYPSNAIPSPKSFCNNNHPSALSCPSIVFYTKYLHRKYISARESFSAKIPILHNPNKHQWSSLVKTENN